MQQTVDIVSGWQKLPGNANKRRMSMELSGAKINFLGDSITFGHGTSAESKRFTNRIAAEQGAICRNYGISGTRIARQKAPPQCPDFDLDFNLRMADMDSDADAVVIFGGTNDFGHGDAPIGSMEDRTCDTFYGALHTLYANLIVKYPTAKIVILTPLHRCNEDNPRGDGNKQTDVGVLRDYVQVIRQVAEFYALPVLDLFAISGLQPRVPAIQQRYIPDGLHPNDAGHQILADLLVRYLRAC